MRSRTENAADCAVNTALIIQTEIPTQHMGRPEGVFHTPRMYISFNQWET